MDTKIQKSINRSIEFSNGCAPWHRKKERNKERERKKLVNHILPTVKNKQAAGTAAQHICSAHYQLRAYSLLFVPFIQIKLILLCISNTKAV